MEDRVKRRLAAILAADVVGYTRLMELDEVGTLAALKARRRDILTPLVAKYLGRVVKVMGDGLLVEFASAVNAVQCAVDLQQSFAGANLSLPDARRIALRIGINLGDVIVEGTDLYGDGINVAARLEGLTDPGDVWVSASVYDQVKGKLDARFDDLGLKALKNVAEPVHVYRVSTMPMLAIGGEDTASRLPLPSKPSIAVLPFTNMSGEAEQDVFTDGLTEDLITDLSRNAGLFVIARHSTFAYKGKSLDVRQIARDLGVRFVLEGSARRAAGRVRISVQLIDAIGGDHLWADRFDRNLEDIFAVQDEVTGKIVEALVGRLTAPSVRSRPKNMAAYELCVRARALEEESPQSAKEACLLLHRAIDLDPSYAEAHGWLALNRWLGWARWGEPEDPNRALAVGMAERAAALDPNDAACRWIYGMLLGYERRWSESDAQFKAALEIDPNQADAWAELSVFSMCKGRFEEALEQIRRAFRLNPHPASWYYLFLGQAQYALREYEAAVSTLRREETYRTGSRRHLAASLAQLGRLEEARHEAELYLVSNPHFTVSGWAAVQPFQDERALAHFVEGFSKAGFPE